MVSVILTRATSAWATSRPGTIVLRERTASATAAMPVSFPPPYGYEAYVASLDVVRPHRRAVRR